jgi:pimeloyl-ACP methyl ester carboxylesterase
MSTRGRRFVLATTLLFGLALVAEPANAQAPVPGPCETGTLPSGALSMICVPSAGWNGELVVFAHGYIAPGQPLGFYHLDLPGGGTVPALVQSFGYAFATTSYRRNGLAILEGVDDIRELLAKFGSPVPTHIAGISEGALVTTLLAERWPELFTTAFAACGPIGSFRAQVDTIGDFRVLFDYFFPGVIPGSPIQIPQAVIDYWDSVYVPKVLGALAANPRAALELMRVSKAAYDPANPTTTIANTTVRQLWYNVFGTNDAVARLGGNPFENRFRLYFGSSNDLRLNLRVKRFAAVPAARERLQRYQTDGDLSLPLVTLHTTGDEVVPYWHELLYLAKADLSGRGRLIPLPVFRYGHCNFTAPELVGAFLLAVNQP